jgi:hypothetical protein
MTLSVKEAEKECRYEAKIRGLTFKRQEDIKKLSNGKQMPTREK